MKFVRENRNKKVPIVVVVAVILIVVGFGAVYVYDYYHADRDAIVEFSADKNVLKKVLENNTIVYETEDVNAGLIFYPGGKV